MRMIASFEKIDTVRFIGHLDLMRALQRALRRSGLPVRYSSGFNPHILLSLASPLPVGVAGREELMDVTLDALVSETYFLKALGAAMPASLPLGRARLVEDKHPKLMAELKTASYVAELPAEHAKSILAAIPQMLEKKSIPAIRKTKSGESPCDIRPMLHALSGEIVGESLNLSFRVSLMEKETLKPDLLLEELAKQAGVMLPEPRLTRTGLLGERDGQPLPLMEC